jgi:hypothetical protein
LTQTPPSLPGLTRQSIFFAKMMDHQNSGVPEFWQFTWTQIGNIRFAVVKPAGDTQAGSTAP